MTVFHHLVNLFGHCYPLRSAVALCAISLLLGFATARISAAQDVVCGISLADAPPLDTLGEADIQHVRLELEVDPSQPPATGRALLSLRTVTPHADSVRLVTGGAAVDEVFSHDLDEALPYRRTAGDTIVIDLRMLRDSLIIPRETISLELSLSSAAGVQHADGVAWTIDPLLLGGAWFPWSGNPSDRFTSELVVTVPDSVVVGASGWKLAERTIEDGRRTYLFATSEPHSADALIFAAGRFVPGAREGAVETHHTGESSDEPAVIAAEALETFAERLDFPYPYGRLSIFIVPGGAPEVAGNGILLLSERSVGTLESDRAEPGAAAIGRGVAQQWFGGVVSAEGWRDSWLVSASRDYAAAMFLNDAFGEESFRMQMRELASEYRQEAELYRRPLTSANAWHPADLDDAHVRGRAVWALHGLRREIGADELWSVLGLLIGWNQFATVSTGDLVRAIEAVTSSRRESFVNGWIQGAGHPELAASYSTRSDTLFLTIEQQQIGPGVPEIYELTLDVEVGALSGSESFEIRLDDLRQTFARPFAAEPRYVAIDPEAHYLMDVSMEQSLSAWIAQLRSASSAHARIAATAAVARRRGDPAVILGLRSALTPDTDPLVKAAILRVMAELSDSDAAQRAVLGAYDDSSPIVRAAALEVLGSYSGSPQVEALAIRAANTDPSDLVRAAAVELLGRIESGEAVGIARAALITPSENDVIRRAGLRTLGLRAARAGNVAFDAGSTYAGPDQPPAVRLEAIELLERTAPHVRRAENVLLDLLGAPEWPIRRAAAEALLRLGHDEAVSAYASSEQVSWLRARMQRLLACS